MNPGSWIPFVTDRLAELWLRTGEHLMLTGCATISALLIGVPLGILIFKKTWLRGPTLGAVGIFQTIPSLAMLVFLLALLQKIGVLPAVIALTLYALLPIVRNTFTGLSGVSPQVMEAAKGIGMTAGQRLRMVRLPLATPVIVAGVRTAAVVSVGIATLSAFIGAGGLGQFINRGLALSNTRLILLGAIPAALLALLVDFSVGAFEWGLRPERKQEKKGSAKAVLRRAALLTPLLLIVIGLLSYFTNPFESDGSPVAGEHGTITVGSKNFTEQLILGELMAQMLEAHTNLKVNRRFNLGGTMICHGALVNGEIDVYAEYTGTGLTAILKDPVISDPDKAFQHVAEAYRHRFDVEWLNPFGFNNTYAMTVRTEDAEHFGWRDISDLGKMAPTLKAGFTAEFAERPDGYPGVSKAYGFRFGQVKDLDPSLMYEAVSNGEVDVICAFATDGRIAAYHLTPLRDNLNFFPPYYAAPVVREEVLRRYPEVKTVLSRLEGVLDNAAMQRLNFEVDGKKRPVGRVVAEFLKQKGLT